MNELNVDPKLDVIERFLPSETNNEACLMEQYLGIKFPVIPKVFRVNRLTEAILRAKTSREAPLRTLMRSFREGVIDTPVALDGKTLIFPRESQYVTSYYKFHENGHAYHFQRDPSITEVSGLAAELILGKLKPEEWKGEEWMVTRTFVEGIGLTTALFTAKRMAEKDKDPLIALDAYQHIDEVAVITEEDRTAEKISALKSGEFEELPDPLMQTDYTRMRLEQLREEVLPLVTVGEGESLDDVKDRMWLVGEYLKDAKYTVGWSFVSRVIRKLESDHELSFANALDWLILHRPRTISDIEDPTVFIEDNYE